MKNHGVAKYALFLTIIVIVAVSAISFARSQQPQSQETNRDERQARDEAERQAIVEALRRGGLKAAAKLKGNYVSYRDPHPDWLSFDLEKLTKYSEAVIIGVPVQNRCQLTEDGRQIITVYDVVVQEVLKGNILQGSTIKVALLGGKVMFPDKTTAEMKTPGFVKMAHNRNYMLYLSQYDVRPGIYDLTAGPQGMIEMPDDGTSVISQARETDPVKKQVKDKDAKILVKEARKEAQKWPHPGKCCK